MNIAAPRSWDHFLNCSIHCLPTSWDNLFPSRHTSNCEDRQQASLQWPRFRKLRQRVWFSSLQDTPTLAWRKWCGRTLHGLTEQKHSSLNSSKLQLEDWTSGFPLAVQSNPSCIDRYISPFEALTGRKMSIGLPNPTPPLSQLPWTPALLITILLANRGCLPTLMNDDTPSSQDSSLVTMCLCDSHCPPPPPPLTFSPSPYIVTQKKGSMVTARSGNNTIIIRNFSYFKPIHGETLKLFDEEEEEEEDD